MRASRSGAQLAVRLPVAIVHRGLRTPRGCPLEGVTLGIQRLRARVRHRDFYLLPFHRAPAVRLRAPRATVVTSVMHASSTTVDPQGQPLFVESAIKFPQRTSSVRSFNFFTVNLPRGDYCKSRVRRVVFFKRSGCKQNDDLNYR